MSDEVLLMVKGGALSGSVLNAISRLINTLVSFGQIIGSAIRRTQTKQKC